MDFAWFAIYALGAAVVVFMIAVVALLIIAWGKAESSQGTVRYVSGETVIVPREPEPEAKRRKAWRVTTERV